MKETPDGCERDPRIREEPLKARSPHPVDVHVGGRVRLRRMTRGMSQETLGRSLGVTFQQIQKYEKGINRIGASRMFELSNVLDVSIQFFFDDYGDLSMCANRGMAEDETDHSIMSFISSPEGIELCRSFSSIQDPALRKRTLELIRTLAQSPGGSRD